MVPFSLIRLVLLHVPEVKLSSIFEVPNPKGHGALLEEKKSELSVKESHKKKKDQQALPEE